MPGTAASDSNHAAQALFDGLAPRYDLLSALLSLGQDRRWRRAMVDPVAAAAPRRVLDVATGPAGVALQVAHRTGAFVAGVDLTPEMLAAGAAKVAAGAGRGQVALGVARAEQLPFPDGSFDALTFTYLLRYVEDPLATLVELARVVAPGGTVASLEFHPPSGPLWRPLWLAYTWAGLPLAGALTGGREWFEVGRFLGPSITGFYRRYPLAWQQDAWEKAGLVDVQVRVMSLGGGVVLWGRKAGDRPPHR